MLPGNTTLRIIHLITGKICDLFAIVFLACFRNKCRIGYQIVNEISTHRPKISDVTDLYRCCPQGKYPGTAIRSKSSQVNGNINLKASGKLCNIDVGEISYIKKMVKSNFHPFSHFILYVRPE